MSHPLQTTDRIPVRHVSWVVVIFLLLPLLAACARQPRVDMPSPYLIEMLPPQSGASSLSVRVTDSAGEPVTHAAVSLEGNMNHAGMVPVLAGPVADADDGSADGVYTAPFEFTMFGDWIVSVQAVIDADAGDAILAEFDFSVGPDGAELSHP